MKTFKVMFLFCALILSSSAYAEDTGVPEEAISAISSVMKKESPWCYEKVFISCEMQFIRHYKGDDKIKKMVQKSCSTALTDTGISVGQFKSCDAHWNAIMDRLLEETKK